MEKTLERKTFQRIPSCSSELNMFDTMHYREADAPVDLKILLLEGWKNSQNCNRQPHLSHGKYEYICFSCWIWSDTIEKYYLFNTYVLLFIDTHFIDLDNLFYKLECSSKYSNVLTFPYMMFLFHVFSELFFNICVFLFLGMNHCLAWFCPLFILDSLIYMEECIHDEENVTTRIINEDNKIIKLFHTK